MLIAPESDPKFLQPALCSVRARTAWLFEYSPRESQPALKLTFTLDFYLLTFLTAPALFVGFECFCSRFVHLLERQIDTEIHWLAPRMFPVARSGLS